nr:MAG TPA: hypothetical protein [Caudoviricetes sp.]
MSPYLLEFAKALGCIPKISAATVVSTYII